MKTCKLTSSVKIAWPVPALAALPYMLADMCVVDGLSFESRNRACEPPWSQTMYRGIGKRSTRRSYTHTAETDRRMSATRWTKTQTEEQKNEENETNLGVRHGVLEELLEILVALLLLVACLAPLRDGLAVEDEDVEEGVE